MEPKNSWRRGAAAALCLAVFVAAPTRNAHSAEGTQIPTPVILPLGGLFTNLTVAISITGATSQIRYTLDGTTPATNSPLYGGVLALSNSCYLQARAFATGAPPSGVAAETFTLLETNFSDFTSTLPLVIVQTFGQPIVADSRRLASMRIVDVATNGQARLRGPGHFEGRAAIRKRGYTSLRYPKVSLAVETLDAAGRELETGLLGMPKDSDWVLYAPYPDKSLVRDALAYEISNQTGRYAARTRFVEVFLSDGANRLSPAAYAGVYVLEEKVKRSEPRVAIHKLGTNDVAEPEISGGYIFKKDHLGKVENDPAPPPPAPNPDKPGRIGYPTGPGGFPADPGGFLPPNEDIITITNVISLTNFVPVTNVVALTNLTPLTNIVATTRVATVTNVTWLTNTLPFTNYITHHHVRVTTNVVSVTNSATVSNIVSVPNVAAFTGVVVFTNVGVFTNVATFTNIAALTNSTVVTNALVTSVVIAITNLTSVTNAAALTNTTMATNVVLTYSPAMVTNITGLTNFVFITNSLATLAAREVLAATNTVVAARTTPAAPAKPSPLTRLVETSQGFISSRTNVFFYVEPKGKSITPAQRAWLSNYVNRFEQALYGPDFRHPTNGYAAFIDLDSFIDHHLIVEATKNIDGFRFSTFFTKDRGGRLKMGPIWDWNLSFGNAKGKHGAEFEHWYWPLLDDKQYSWFRRLFEDPDFGQRYVDRWAELRANVFATSNLWARVGAMAAALKEPAARNFARWPVLETNITSEPIVGKTYEDQISYLKTWASNRLAWINAQFLPPPLPLVETEVAAGSTLALTSAVGRVYFTLDGTDPRLPGGRLSPAARTNDLPLTVTNELRIFARVQQAQRWSCPMRARVVVRPGPAGSSEAYPPPTNLTTLAAADLSAGDDLFTNQTIRRLRLDVPPAAMEILRGYAFRADAPRAEKPEVLCVVHESTNVWTNVALHLKGSAGSFRALDSKPSFTLSFSKHVSQERFHGLKKVSLNNSAQDPTRLSEKLYRELYARGGVPAPRAGYITVELNGRPLGLYVLLEGWDRQFVRRHFPDDKGPLYEGPFLTDLDQPSKLAFGQPANNGLNPTSLVAAAREPDPANRRTRLESKLDMDRFTRHLALDMLAWNGDGYALHANNYRIFHDRSQERLVFLPHGMDQMSYLPDAPLLAGGDGIVASAVLSLPECRRQVLDRIREFRRCFFQPEAISRRALELTASLAAVMARETNAPDAITPAAHAQAVRDLVQRITERLASIDQQLTGITNLAKLRAGQTIALNGWARRPIAGTPAFLQPADTLSLGVRTAADGAGVWATLLWLEEGRYRLSGRLRAAPAAPGATNQFAAGFRVRSSRKRSLGLDWGWDSRRRGNYRPGGETGNLVYQPLPSAAGTNWSDLACEIDLRQPAADLEIFCEASGAGEAWFDLPSLKLTRLSDPGR